MAAAVCIAVYLARGGGDDCGGGCGDLLSGGGSALWGVPVAWLGGFCYGAALLASWARSGPGNFCGQGMSGLVLGAGLWFVAMQSYMGKFCLLCCLTHGLAGMGGLLLWRPGFARPCWAGGLVAIGLLAAGQGEHFIKGPGRVKEAVFFADMGGTLRFLDHSYETPRADLPCWGPQASGGKSFAVVTNYACQHCLHLLRELGEVKASFPKDAFSVYFIPVSTKPATAEAEAWMLALWRADPGLFHTVEEKIIAGSLVLDAAAIRQMVPVGKIPAVEALLAPARQRLVANGVMVQAASKTYGLQGYPQLWFPQQGMAGVPSGGWNWVAMLAKQLQVHLAEKTHLSVATPLVELAECPAGGWKQWELTVKNEGQQAAVMQGLMLPKDWIAEAAFPLHLAAGEVRAVPVRLCVPTTLGKWSAQVRLKCLAVQHPSVTFSGYAVAAIRGWPSQWELPEVPVGGGRSPQEMRLLLFEKVTAASVQGELPGYTMNARQQGNEAVISLVPDSTQPSTSLPGTRVGVVAVTPQWPGWEIAPQQVAVSVRQAALWRVTPRRILIPTAPQWDGHYRIAIRPAQANSTLVPDVVLPAKLKEAGVTTELLTVTEGYELLVTFPTAGERASYAGQEVSLVDPTGRQAALNLPIQSAGAPKTF